nr:retrovirus-related Pol polyprotein from transposon TNT 1-94 [Tanacetum cinerariifolium]
MRTKYELNMNIKRRIVTVLMALAEENDVVSKEGARNGEWVKISMRKVHTLLEMKDNNDIKVCLDYLCIDLNYVEEQRSNLLIIPSESQRNTTDSSVAVTESLATDYDLADEYSVCSIPLPPLKKLDGAEPISGPKTIKLILKSKSTFKAEALKDVTINEPSSAPAKGNKSSSASKVDPAPAGKLKSVKNEDDPPLAIHLKSLGRMSSRPSIPRPSKCFFPPCIHYGGIDHLSNECLYYPICKLCGSYDHDTNGHNRIISLERKINIRNPQHAFKKCEALQAKKAEALKSTRGESSNANRSKSPTKCGCSRHTTSVKSYSHKYMEQLDLRWCLEMTLLAQLKATVLSNVLFDEKRGTIFNSNKEGVMIALRVRDVYVIDMTSSAQESCFLAKASENLNWLWHKRLAHLNFKTINKLEKQNLVIRLPLLVYSKDKPCSACEKGKHHEARFKTKQTSTIKKCLHLLHIDLFGPITPRSINHEKYTLVIIDEYSRYQANPKESHLTAVKRIFRYLKGTPSLGLWYLKYSGFNLKGYSNSDYAGCNMDRKSTSGACQFLGGKLVCWSAKKQQSVAMSLAEAEYVAAVGCCANILWMKSQLTNYDIIYKKVPIFCDNTSAIAISNNPVLYSRIKHIDTRYHFIIDHVLKWDIELHFIPTQYQLVDIFTKTWTNQPLKD